MQPHAAKTRSAKVFIVDDDAAFRRSLGWLLESAGEEVEACSSAEQFLHSYDPDQVGCLVLDFRLPGMSGIGLLETMKARGWCLPAIVLTGFADTSLAIQALRLGAFDFVEKPVDHSFPDRVSSAIEVHEQALRAQRLRASQQQRLATLTRREREVMDLVVQGHANKVIAFDLRLSEKTVEVHRARVMQKLHVRSLADLVRFAVTISDIGSPSTHSLGYGFHSNGANAFAA